MPDRQLEPVLQYLEVRLHCQAMRRRNQALLAESKALSLRRKLRPAKPDISTRTPLA